MEREQTLHVTNRAAWRDWLAKHHDRATEIWLIYYRQGTGQPRISYNDAVEEALCYGWIDSTVKSVDGERYMQRFSPRKRSSGLSQMNKERVRKLIAEHRMTRAGLDAIAHVFDPATDRPRDFVIPDDILQPLMANERAWQHFQQFPESYQRIRIAFIDSRRRHGQEQFQRSLAHFIKMTAQNKRIGAVKEMR
jgi:uncharacterized protein YdeI (YjbR/CyaY-like superfamily)